MGEYPNLPNSPIDVKKSMLEDLGLKSIDQLYGDVPEEILLNRELDLPVSVSESEVYREMKDILGRNFSADYSRIFLGAGVWPHLIPAVVPALTGRGEFLTAYTP